MPRSERERGKSLWRHGGSAGGSRTRWLKCLSPAVQDCDALLCLKALICLFLVCTGRNSLQEKEKPSTLVVVSPTFTSSDVDKRRRTRKWVSPFPDESLNFDSNTWVSLTVNYEKYLIEVKIQSNHFITVEIFTQN